MQILILHNKSFVWSLTYKDMAKKAITVKFKCLDLRYFPMVSYAY